MACKTHVVEQVIRNRLTYQKDDRQKAADMAHISSKHFKEAQQKYLPDLESGTDLACFEAR